MKLMNSNASSMLATIVFALLSQHGFSATIYANSATGSDGSGDGSSGNPYKSFNTAYTNASNGDIINLTGTFDWTSVDESGDVSITGYTLTKSITIQGQGAGSTYIQAASSANTADRCVFTIDHDVTIYDVTIRYGYNVDQANNSGGITIMDNTRLNTVTISDCVFEYNAIDNSATSTYYFAGAICMRGNTTFHPVLNVSNSEFNNNTANGKAYGAGAIYSVQANDIVIDNCTFDSNTSLDASSFGIGYHNVAGAIGFFRFNDIRVSNSTFVSNSSESSGGAILAYYNHIYLTNNTIVSNSVSSASGKGGGVYIVDMQNSSGQLWMKNNLIANSTVNGSGEDMNFDGATSSTYINDNGYNIVENYTGASITLSATGDLTGEQGSLNISGTLSLNGTNRVVRTLSLSSGSVAIDAGNSSANGAVSVPSSDQRGATRSGTTDIGAFEFGGGGLPIELISFEAIPNGDDVKLIWETASEKDNEKLQIYRSIDGEDWQQIAEQDGAGNSTSTLNYTEMDYRLKQGVYYYFLRQIDYDGNSSDSYVVSASIVGDDIVVLPNPAMSSIQLSTEIEGTYSICDRLGKIVLQDYKGTLPIDISSLEAGIYFLHIDGNTLPFSKLD